MNHLFVIVDDDQDYLAYSVINHFSKSMDRAGALSILYYDIYMLLYFIIISLGSYSNEYTSIWNHVIYGTLAPIGRTKTFCNCDSVVTLLGKFVVYGTRARICIQLWH